MASIHVRTATIADADAMGRVHVRSWQAAYRGIFPDALLDGLDPAERAASWRSAFEARAEPVGGRRLVVQLDGEVAGFALVRSAVNDDEPGLGEVVLLYLEQHAWGTGAGPALFAECVSTLVDRGYANAVLWVAAGNARARRFYEREGWSADGASRVDVLEGAEIDEVRYRRSLI